MPQEFIYTFKPQANRVEARCGIRVLWAPTGDLVVIATELPDNPGMSITNAAEEVATTIYQEYGQGQIEPQQMLWIEHYLERVSSTGLIPESFDLVTFRWDGRQFTNPDWRRLGAQELAFLTGGVVTPATTTIHDSHLPILDHKPGNVAGTRDELGRSALLQHRRVTRCCAVSCGRAVARDRTDQEREHGPWSVRPIRQPCHGTHYPVLAQ